MDGGPVHSPKANFLHSSTCPDPLQSLFVRAVVRRLDSFLAAAAVAVAGILWSSKPLLNMTAGVDALLPSQPRLQWHVVRLPWPIWVIGRFNVLRAATQNWIASWAVASYLVRWCLWGVTQESVKARCCFKAHRSWRTGFLFCMSALRNQPSK